MLFGRNLTLMPSKDSKLQGDSHSNLEYRILNQRVSNRDLILASMNPLVEALNSTDTQMKFSKPFYHCAFDPKGKIDVEKSRDMSNNFEDIDFFNWAQIASKDAFNFGRGVAELAYGYSSDSGYIDFTAMERRPTSSFIRPIDSKIKSTALRFKGFYYKDGVLYFDQTIQEGNNSGKVISLDPKRVFSLGVLGATFPDESILEFLIPYLDGAADAFSLSFVVMHDQINPEDIVVTEEQPGDDQIIQKLIENRNSVEKVAIPPNMVLQNRRYYDKKDVLDFYNHFVREMYKIVFPIAVLSDSGGAGSALLDNSSSAAKISVFFSYVQSGRIKLARETTKLGNLWLDLNGFKKQGYRYELIPAPIEPKDLVVEQKIMAAARKQGSITDREYRNWINTSVSGIRLEEEFEGSDGVKVQPQVDESVKRKMKKIEDGDPESILDNLAE